MDNNVIGEIKKIVKERVVWIEGKTFREYLVSNRGNLAEDDRWLQEKEISYGDKLLQRYRV